MEEVLGSRALKNWASDVSGGREGGNRGGEGIGLDHGGLECQGVGLGPASIRVRAACP